MKRRSSRRLRRRFERAGGGGGGGIGGEELLGAGRVVALEVGDEEEATGRHPAYVLLHVDYSSGRKDPLKRELRVSSSEEQLRAALAAELAENVKKCWDEAT